MAQTVYPLETRKARIQLTTAGQGGEIHIVTGTTDGSTGGLTAMGSLAGVAIGAKVSGAGIPTGPAPTVTAMSDTAHTVTISANTTAAHSAEPITFTDPGDTPISGLNGSSMRLYQATITPGQNTVLADLLAAEASFPGYAPIVGAFTTGFVPSSGIPQSISQLLSWAPTDSTTPQTIRGVFASDGTIINGIWPLDADVALVSPANELSVVCADAFPSPGFLTQVRP